jgi:hypothetical protein
MIQRLSTKYGFPHPSQSSYIQITIGGKPPWMQPSNARWRKEEITFGAMELKKI